MSMNVEFMERSLARFSLYGKYGVVRSRRAYVAFIRMCGNIFRKYSWRFFIVLYDDLSRRVW